MRPPFPTVFDSSLLGAFRSCPAKAKMEYFEHWRHQGKSVHLVAGGAYAAGLEAMRRAFYVDGIDEATALVVGGKTLLEFYGDFECPEDSAKSAQRTLGALEYYAAQYPLGVDRAQPITVPGDKGRGIEMGFNEPIDLNDPEMRHPETGDPLLYCGRADMLVEYQSMRLGLDDKTTSSLGAKWPDQWNLRSQFTGYSWGFAKIGLPLNGWLIRGVSILKTKYDTMEAITYRPEWEIERWHHQLKRDILKMRFMWETGYFDFNLDHACTEFGGCMFRQVCKMRDPQLLLDQQFERRRWDPVHRREIPVTVTEDGRYLEGESA